MNAVMPEILPETLPKSAPIATLSATLPQPAIKPTSNSGPAEAPPKAVVKSAPLATSTSNSIAATRPSADFQDWTRVVFARLSNRFQHGSGIDLLNWSIETFGTALSIGTGFGASGIVLMDLALRVSPDVDIFYIDTDYFFPETYDLINRLEQHYQRSLRRVASELTIAQQAKRFGPKLYENDPNLCCHVRKVLPLDRALADSTAWVTALRHDQSSTRKDVSMVKWNEKYNVVKISPLAYWTEADIWEYIHEHQLPYNTLHDQNYPSIGCWPCTRPAGQGEDLRAGRWQGLDKKECGLHGELVDYVI